MENVDYSLYFIMGSMNVDNPFSILEDALKGGITCFQFREKGRNALVGNEKKAFAQSCQRLCAQYGVPFIVNDDVDLAIEIDADGVHVGQDDACATEVRKKIGPTKLLGVSVHSVEEARMAIEAGANYVGMGPVYATPSKADAKPVAGTSMIQHVANLYPDLPIVGIGGIATHNLGPVIQAGATGVSVISAIASAKDAEMATADLKGAFLQWKTQKSTVQG
ncbi:thiamine phosphate synthase [Sporosarcina sp. Sa2YVA2]|uniref:Thiamine-phosphate synthase n=1 Tax=Sporosarcina quadrami TaxID=2762234 RepID=A0ABR8UAA9_9BACL|nr:thiamine phosphate synthase [Sporosarcina quadrami]MBD7984946.1 thiamine phosphate synthase [Sporosarcina quadrami]